MLLWWGSPGWHPLPTVARPVLLSGFALRGPGAEEPGATVDGALVLVLPLLPLMISATSEPGICGV